MNMSKPSVTKSPGKALPHSAHMTMKIFAARYLLPMGSPLIEDGALLVADSRIVAVASRRELLAAHPQAGLVDCGESVLLPTLVNAHTHLELSDFPVWAESCGEGDELVDFISWIERLVKVRRGVGPAERRASLVSGLAQSIAAGSGLVGDILSGYDVVDAYAGTPLAGVVFAEVLGHDAQEMAARLARCAALFRQPPAMRLTWGLSPHAPYTLTAQTLKLAVDCARGEGMPLAMHWAETAEETDFLSHGTGPIAERLYPAAGWSSNPAPLQPQALPTGSLLIHGASLEPGQLPAIAAAGHHLVLCPRSNSRFGVARAPVADCRQAGVPLALGTDSLASSPSLSVWGELAFARQWFTGALDPLRWLEIATCGGAAALGLGHRLGRLQPGFDASFQAVALPAGATAASLAEALCARGEETAPQLVCLAGELACRHNGPLL